MKEQAQSSNAPSRDPAPRLPFATTLPNQPRLGVVDFIARPNGHITTLGLGWKSHTQNQSSGIRGKELSIYYYFHSYKSICAKRKKRDQAKKFSGSSAPMQPCCGLNHLPHLLQSPPPLLCWCRWPVRPPSSSFGLGC